MLTKLSILTLFLRFIPWGNLRISLYIVMILVVVYSLMASFVWVYACQPIDKYWDKTITGGTCINWFKISLFSAIMNSVTDAAILMLPILFLRKLQLPTRQKIGIIIVLMTGGLYVVQPLCVEAGIANTQIRVLIVSVIRLYLMLTADYKTDFSWDVVPSYVWQ